MRFLIGKREFVYYFTQYMYADLLLVEIPGNELDFIELANNLDYEVLSYGDNLNIGHILIPRYSLKDFADLFYERRNSGNTSDKELLDEYCSLIDDFLK